MTPYMLKSVANLMPSANIEYTSIVEPLLNYGKIRKHCQKQKKKEEGDRSCKNFTKQLDCHSQHQEICL